RGAVIWENDEPNRLDMSLGLTGQLRDDFYFPGKDRAGVLKEVMRELRGEEGAVPTVFDNIHSLAVSFAVLKSIEEDRTVELSEIL
ncbi:MAG TPA: hypothetical protein DCM61_00215, partial [Clostridiales bacterium]|nr:hypothetical protein [Clostridiales bacterium]